MGDPLVSMEDIVKSFPGVQALRRARFDLAAGEVHALVGENGAGKSTLMKVLTGAVAPDAGRIIVRGKARPIASPREAQALGISMIHQEFHLMPHLTVAQNIFIGREPRRFRFFLSERELNRRAEALLASFRLDLDPRSRVGDLTVAKQQMVEIAKALSVRSDVLIMDEPTSALTDVEAQELFRIIRRLKEEGVGVVYISHRLEEVKAVSDRVTVMRDGRTVGTVETSRVSVDDLIRMMVGREIFRTLREGAPQGGGEVVLEVENLRRGRAVKGVSFYLKRGEILGLAGLMGAGRTEVARAIFGADRADGGSIRVMGRHVRFETPSDAVRNGIGYLSEDRKRYGLILGLDVETNIALASFSRFVGRLGWIKRAKLRSEAARRVEELGIRTPRLEQKVKYLSGGNQQKVVIAKWLARECDILIFDEPTRGIDVGAKNEIHQLLDDLARSGKSIVMISSELPEILRMSHRILVMCEGRITGELSRAEATEERIIQYATRREADGTAGAGGRAETGV